MAGWVHLYHIADMGPLGKPVSEQKQRKQDPRPKHLKVTELTDNEPANGQKLCLIPHGAHVLRRKGRYQDPGSRTRLGPGH